MRLHQQFFKYIHTSNLVYNTCWEDPRSDRGLLHFDANSKVVMITSAGCNALDYLLDQPASIDCVDMNPRQNALLDLKLSLFQRTDFDTLKSFFGTGHHRDAGVIFKEVLMPHLNQYAARYWEKQVRVFAGKGLRKSFYFHGSSGMVAFFIKQLLQMDKKIARSIQEIFETDDLFRQRALYYDIEPALLNKVMVRVLDSHFVQSMLGVPRSQQRMARQAFKDGMAGYFRTCLRKVFTELPLKDNYFWRVYCLGTYSDNCCPNYLKPANFDVIRRQTAKIKTHTNTLSGFLKKNPGQYTHFVLLDHQDWLAANDQPALHEEWQLVLQNSAPGAKILLRSAAPDRHFIPNFVANFGTFQTKDMDYWHHADRVGTYASTHLFNYQP